MSDRYETPRWDAEPEELAPRSPGLPPETASPEDAVRDEGSRPAELDLETSSENVLDAWSVDEPAPADRVLSPGVEEPGPAGHDFSAADDFSALEDVPAEQDLASPEVEAPAEDRPAEEPSTGPAPLADHVSGSTEHAPGELTVPPGYSVLEGVPSGERRAVGVVVSRYNGDVTTKLLESALAELDVCGVPREGVTVMPVPGAFELPLAAMALAKTRRFACVVALGCVIRGDTPHFDYVSSEAASGLQLAGIETGVPVSFGVLTLDRADQAESRIGKGAEAVRTGLEMADLFANLRAAAAR